MKFKKSKGDENVTAAILTDAKLEAAAIVQSVFDYGAKFTESPIERILMAQLIHPATAREFDTRVELLRPESGMVANALPPPLPGIYIYPQIIIGDYRVDFYIANVGHRESSPLIVECDGHDFHEKTKEQAQRDKARDRYLVSQGYRVLRFTGSEIFRDAEKVATEIISVLLDIT